MTRARGSIAGRAQRWQIGDMRQTLSPAVERVLAHAARWASGEDTAPIDVPELLLGLVEESETRAGGWLAAGGVDAAAIREHWPTLNAAASETRAGRYSRAVRAVLRASSGPIGTIAANDELTTEDLLAGLLAESAVVSDWLRQRGLPVDDFRRYWEARHGAGLPLNVDDAPDEQPAVAQPAAREAQGPHVAGGEAPTRLWRTLDAAANRAREAARVVEDYLRFILHDRHLTRRVKELRHELAAALAALPGRALLAARDTPGDVGTGHTTTAESRRADAQDVLQANCKRWQEALRSLEEYAKPVAPAVAEKCKQLRYAAYTLERAAVTTESSQRRLEAARLYVLIDGRASDSEFAALVQALVGAGVHMLQLRDKQLTDRELLARARLARRLTRASETLLIVNDRADIAALADADGVHVGQDELTVAEARSLVGTRGLVGVSTHSLDQARRAVLDGADYLGVGPTFPSGTKTFAHFPGTRLLAKVAAEISLPAFAVGGITVQNLPQVREAGFTRAAVSGAVVSAPDPGAAASELLRLLTAGS
jgi:thiamine-phosphate pyrophosphorylase